MTRFRSNRMMRLAEKYEEEEMYRFAAFLIYDQEMDHDQVIDRFVNEFGDDNQWVVEAILDELSAENS